MVLCPPGEVENQTPLYTFHVSPSCFQPMSFITTVKRGGPGSKQLIARFEYVNNTNGCAATISLTSAVY